MPCNSVSDLFLAVLRSSISILCQSHLSRSDSSTFGAIPQQLAACQFRTQPLPVPSLPHFVSLCHRHAVRLHSLLFLRFAILFVAAHRVTNASPSGSSRAIPQHSKLFRFLAVCFGSILIPRAAQPVLTIQRLSVSARIMTAPIPRTTSRLETIHHPRRTSRFRSEPIRRSPAHYAADLCHARAGRCSSALIRSDSYPVSSLPCCSGAAQLQSKPLVALPVLFHSIRCRAGANQFSSDLRYASPLPNRSRHC